MNYTDLATAAEMLATTTRSRRSAAMSGTGLPGSSTAPDLGEGVIQAFRRKECPAAAMLFPLRGLDPAAAYVVTDLDQPDKPVTVDGRKLMEAGLSVAMPAASQAGVIVYRRV